MAPLQTHELRIELTEDDRPEDRFSQHVNNARYFAFINRTFHGWYVRMGLRGATPDYRVVMAHVSYDFLREVAVPGTIRCRIATVKPGRSSLEHEVQMWDISGEQEVLAGRGRVVHVCLDSATRKAVPWPTAILAQCWDGAAS